MRLPLRVVRPVFLSLVILSCAPERVISPNLVVSEAKRDVGVNSASKVVISKVYGGGGNAGATYRNDFIEVFNRSTEAVSVTGWTVQYASSGGNSWQKTTLTGTIEPGRFQLIQEAAGTGGTVPLPTPDATGSIALSATAGKVALVRNGTSLACGSTAVPCMPPMLVDVADLVGFGSGTTLYEGTTGPTPAPSNTRAVVRKNGGCIDTDNNATDFATTDNLSPRNSATATLDCSVLAAIASITVRVSWVTPGTSFHVTASAVDDHGQPLSPSLVWSTAPTSIATVDPETGVATGVATGIATITATALNNVSGSAPLFVVNDGDLASVSLTVDDPAQAPVGFTKPAFATSRLTTFAIVTPALTWSSSDPSIAAVSSLGYISALAPGTVTIRATGPNGVYGEVPYTVLPATAPTTAIYHNHVEFGVPTDNTPDDELSLTKPQYVESYNKFRGGPNWVSWEINSSQFGSADRCNCFTADQTLPEDVYHVVDFDYRNGGYDRGHMVQSLSRSTTDQENASTFLLTNILPQGAENNQGPWSAFENYLDDQARASNGVSAKHEIYVIAGGTYANDPPTLKDEHKVAVPDYTWKIAVIMPDGEGLADVHSSNDLQVIAVKMPNLTTPGVPQSSVGIRNKAWDLYRVSVHQLENETGYDFLSSLPDDIERQVEDASPTAVLDAPSFGVEGSSLAFDAGGSSDPDDGTLTYIWNFGDGSNGTGVNPSHTYADNGSYQVTLTVKDPLGAQDSKSKTVTIANAAPVASGLTASTGILSGESVFASATFSDAGVNDAPWSYVFDWGAGNTHEGVAAVQTSAVGSSRSFFNAGTYTVTFTVTDKDHAASVARSTSFTILRIPTSLLVNPERINIQGPGNGQVIVTVLGTTAFAGSSIDLGSVRIVNARIDVRGSGASKAQVEDVNQDGITDLVLHFDRDTLVADGQLTSGTTQLVLMANLSDGRQIEASGDVDVRSVKQ
jgi:DNA/RNA endonuclease G (NUC1)